MSNHTSKIFDPSCPVAVVT